MGDDPREMSTASESEKPGIVTRFWNGASAIVNKYQKRRRALDDHTSEKAREAIGGIF
jgi:hypothetical protein